MTTIQLTDPIRGSSEPGRFWTLTNVGEATPDVLSPLCWSVWGDGVEFGGRASLCDLGALPKSAVRRSENPNELLTACFYGRQAMNIDLTRDVMATVPGSNADDFEADICGSVRPDAKPVPNSNRRLPIVAVKAPATFLRHGRQVRQLHHDQLSWWQRQILGGSTTDPLALFNDSADRFRIAMRVHVRARMLVQALRSQVLAALEDSAKKSAGALLSGHGNVLETAMADDLWLLGRNELTLDTFLSRHGFHGPNEGNLIGHSWRENPATVLNFARATAERAETDRPREREGRAIAAHERALAELPGGPSRVLRFLLKAAGTHTRYMELTKSSYLTAIDGCRRGAREFGAALVAKGVLEEADDVFYFDREELNAGLGAEAAEQAAFRKARREEYRALELPSFFTGMPKPTEQEQTGDSEPDVIHGTSGGPGRVEGKVRVVVDPDVAEPLDDGEILVCRFTDPGWTPLFSLASGVVIDIGSPASHGAIVARELALPCVIGTGDGSRHLRDGDVVRVDGDAGIVTVLSRARAVDEVGS
jgi:pyruvate,water dikinase